MTSSPITTDETSSVTIEQANELLLFHRDIMEKIAFGREQDYQAILDQLCKAAEFLIPDAVASIMIFDDSKTFLQVLSAPSLPDDAVEALNGLIPGKQAGSCGTAVYSNEPQYVFNTCSDLRWSGFQQFVIDFSVGACWSMPLRIDNETAIGSFALSSFEERQPSDFHIHLLEISANIASLVIKRQKEQEHLWKMAHHDALTGLPNRTLLALRLQHSIEKTHRNHQKVAVLFLDLDNFKCINDQHGHDAGDQALKIVAKEIRSSLRPEDTLARLGGDEFVIIIESYKNTENLSVICNKILNSVKACNDLINSDISASIGVSISPDHGDTFDKLLSTADKAMYKAKANGRSTFHIHSN